LFANGPVLGWRVHGFLVPFRIMKNYLLRFAVPVLLSLAALPGSAWGQGRIATVDLGRVLDNYFKKRQAETILKERIDEADKEEKNRADDWKKRKEEYDAVFKTINDPAISPAERDKRESEATEKKRRLNDMQAAIEDYRRSSNVRIQDQRNRLMGGLLGEITNAISARAKSAGYSMVLDTAAVSASGAPVVAYSNRENDITDGVLTDLNRGNTGADAIKPDEKAPPAVDPKKAPAKKP
jgi:outer membrane protein